MLVDELDLSDEIKQALAEQGFVELHPPQAEAIPIALSGRNLVVAVPTASGKSLIGYCAALKRLLEEGRRVLYIVPLKALAAEKRDDFERFSYLGFKVGLSTGDLDSDDTRLSDCDVLVATSEKADSLMRHGSKWIESVGLTICDEVHMLHDPGRGPTLEVTLTKMMRKNWDMQVIALSATISNAIDLAHWMDAELVRSDWRPIELKEGVYHRGEITFRNGDVRPIEEKKEEVWALVSDMVRDGGQCLVFVNSRRSTEALAVRYSKDMAGLAGMTLTDEEIEILEGGAETTAVGRKLASCVKSGIAFHNAGLEYKQRQFVEKEFRSGRIKCIVATPTLAAGINLPARRVIIRDTARFEAGSGNAPIAVMEIKQMCGRAGRPGYDPYGEAILMAKSEEDAQHLMEDYIECDSENIMSKLGNEKTLRTHILGLIATNEASSIDDIIDFLRDTFYGCQSNLYGVEGAVENVVEFLAEEGMIADEDGVLMPLQFGKRVSDLYIDPESAVILRDAVMLIKDTTDDMMLMHAVAYTPDVMGLYPRKSDMDALFELYDKYDGQFLMDVPEEGDYHFEYFLSALKVAMMASEWIDEREEDVITAQMGIGPGDIRSRVDNMEWLTYAMIEIATICRPETVKRIRPLLTRLRYGVRNELLELVLLKGVGRSKARTLYDNGIRNKADIVNTDAGTIAALPRFGHALARSLKEQTGSWNAAQAYASYDEPGPVMTEEKKEEKVVIEEAPIPDKGPKQTSLFDF
ncbi:MAG: DEAD/DEAH box helicase [Candidatus Methanomethylophilaceae archaeon]|nr:DEAD/DEAH box helicase [Candidatus Methanomethylophilaceae archaeon]